MESVCKYPQEGAPYLNYDNARSGQGSQSAGAVGICLSNSLPEQTKYLAEPLGGGYSRTFAISLPVQSPDFVEVMVG
jgi:hypothetical protein